MTFPAAAPATAHRSRQTSLSRSLSAPRGERSLPRIFSCCLHRTEFLLCLARVRALRILRDDAVKVKTRLGGASESRQRRGQIEEYGIALAVIRVQLDDSVPPLHRAVVTVPLDVVAGDDVIVLGETVEHIVHPLIHLRT